MSFDEPDWGHLFGITPQHPPVDAPVATKDGEPAGEVDLAGMSVPELEAYLLALLEEVARDPQVVLPDDLHADGTRAISSQIAVALLGAAAQAVGRERLVNLADTDDDDLRSIGGLARLVRDSLHEGSS